MKKFLFTCFLALLCLVGRYLAASTRVADSPTEEPLHRSALLPVSPHSGDTHRGGETLSDTFSYQKDGMETSTPATTKHPAPQFSLELSGDEALRKSAEHGRGLRSVSLSNQSTVDRGPTNLPSPVSRLRSPDDWTTGQPDNSTTVLRTVETSKIQNPKSEIGNPKPGFSLVDDSTSQGQEEGNTPARVGEGHPVLIYGEINSTDSLGPLLLVTTPYYIDPYSTYLRSEQEIVPQPGEFFDGVLNPRTKKFSAELSLSGRPGYFSLLLEDRPLLENYLIFPGDSLKISLDLMRMEVLFAGVNAAFYEAQYAVKREQNRTYFDAPRQLITSRNARIFKKPENQEKMAGFKDQFGAKLLVLEPGKESLDYLLKGLEHPSELDAQLGVLDRFAEELELEEYELLRTEIICGFYYSGLSGYRKFHHPYVESLPVEEQTAYQTRVKDLIRTANVREFGVNAQLVSAGFLNLSLEVSIMEAIWEGKSFLAAVDGAYSPGVADRIRAGYLSHYLSALPDQENYIRKFLEVTKTAPWRERILSLERSHITGDTIQPVTLYGLDGETYDREDLTGKPTLLYFYFSTCAHSADYFEKRLFPLYQQTADLGYRLIAISVDQDPELWKSRIDRYSDPSLLNLNLRGEDKERWRSYYELYSFPKTMLLDEAGRIVSFDIRNLGNNYESLEQGFLELYRDKITNHTPFSETDL